MSFSHEYNFPVFVGTGKVLTSGHSSTLGKGQIGVFNPKTGNVFTGNVTTGQPLILAQGSYHTVDKLGLYTGGLTQSDKSIEFRAGDIISFERSMPRTAKAEQWIIGWDGTNTCGSLAFQTGSTYRFLIKVWGEDVYGTYLHPVAREITLTTAPTADGVATAMGTKAQAQALAALINNDPELKYFVRADVIASDYSAGATTYTTYQLIVPDTGDQIALAAVQAIYPTLVVTRVSRTGILSTYNADSLTGGGAPANFTPTSDILLAACGVCPGGYSHVTSKDVYVISRALASSDDIHNTTAQGTYAAAVATAYSAAGTGVFLGQTGDVARVQISVTAGTAVAPINSDTVTKTHTTDDLCTPPAGTAISWSATSITKYKKTRTLTMTMAKTCGGANRLTDIQAFYANDTSIVGGSGTIAVQTAGTCSDSYTLTQQTDNNLADGCLSEDIPVYHDLQAFEGMRWDLDPCVDPGLGDATVKAGVRITTAYVGSTFQGCSFFPTDYYSVRPLKLEVTQLVHGPGVDNGGGLPVSPTPSKKLRNASMATQSGEWMIRELIKANKYRVHGDYFHDPRLREVLDNTALQVVDRTKNYISYHLRVQQNRTGQNFRGDFAPEIYEFTIAFAVGTDVSTFEQTFTSITSQVGVNLIDR